MAPCEQLLGAMPRLFVNGSFVLTLSKEYKYHYVYYYYYKYPLLPIQTWVYAPSPPLYYKNTMTKQYLPSHYYKYTLSINYLRPHHFALLEAHIHFFCL